MLTRKKPYRVRNTLRQIEQLLSIVLLKSTSIVQIATLARIIIKSLVI